MDGNKDEALKCLKIGREALELGDRTRALKFITKARRLDPTLPVEDLLSTLEEEESRDTPYSDSPTRSHGARDEASSSSSSSKPEGNSSVRHRVSSIEYTEDQISIVRQVKKQKCYYEVLGLERNCSVEDVKKAYRKLSLKVHPDKNKAPGAEEAFKAVSKAFQCLSDDETRKRYDLVGSEEVEYERPVGRRGRAAAQGLNNGFYDTEFDADEIFRNFFFGGMPRTATTTTQFGGFSFRNGMGANARRTRDDHGSGGFNVRALVQLLPILLVVLLNILPSADPIYSFLMSHPYVHHYSTHNRGVHYYVKTAKFEQEYPVNGADRVALEEEVERDYFSILGQNCRLELQRFQWGLIGETPNCDKLKQFEMVT